VLVIRGRVAVAATQQSVSAQLEREIVRRLGVLVLLGGDAAAHVVEAAAWEPGASAQAWAETLLGPDRVAAARAADGILEALWPVGSPPKKWNRSPLGVAISQARPLGP
jgi:hypothetical protein